MHIFLPFGSISKKLFAEKITLHHNKRTFFCCLVRFVTNFLLKNFSPLYKGTFFAYLACIFDFFHKDFILVPLLYSQTLFCHLAHFSRNFRKKIIPYHISERFSAIWSTSYELSAKNISTPNIDTFFAFGPLI